MPEAAEIDRVTRADATARRILSKGQMPVQGALVGVRLNLNIMRSTGVCVHTLHRGGKETGPAAGRGFWDGEVIGYAPVVTLENAWLSVKQSGREAIARGVQAKHPMASIDGVMHGTHSLTGVEARFDPKTTHLFVDEERYAVRWAQHVTVMGHRAYMRGTIVYHSAKTAPPRARPSAPSKALIRKEHGLWINTRSKMED